MKLRGPAIGLGLVLATAGAAFVAYRQLVLPESACSLCGREIHPTRGASVRVAGRRPVAACCPRCALHYALQEAGSAAAIDVEDGNTGEKLDARSATFVEAANGATCSHGRAESAPRAPGVSYDRTYDRCLPSLVAFRSEAEARAYQRRSGGRILDYAEAAASVRHR